MVRRTRISRFFTENRDTLKKPQMRKEVGAWLYKRETVEAFQLWCRQNGVKAFNNVRITSAAQYARCLRATKDLYPGEAIIVAPHGSTLNFLRVVHEMYDTQHNFPVAVNWMNHNQRVPYLLGASHAELALAGWMVRVHSLENSFFSPYVKWLLEDTRGRDGVSQGMGKERSEETSYVDQVFSEMAIDACEDPDVWLENLFRSFAALHLRGMPLEVEAMEPLLDGTDFFKTKANEISCPTLIPLVDAIPQLEDGNHNVMVEYFAGPRCSNEGSLSAICRDINVPRAEMDVSQLKNGFFALRAIAKLSEGDYLYHRGYPKTLRPDEEALSANMLEASRLMQNEYPGA
jgi:hypothetical protein